VVWRALGQLRRLVYRRLVVCGIYRGAAILAYAAFPALAYIPLAMGLSLFSRSRFSELYRIMANGAGTFSPVLLVIGSVLIVVSFKPGIGAADLPEPIIIAVP